MMPTKTVLVVDDSATMRRMVIASLDPMGGLSFEQAENGLNAIEQLALRPVDLVVLDLNMPDVHGLEVLRFIRGHQAFRGLPVVVLTTRGDEPGRQAALREGASVYMTKPFAPDVLGREVKRLLDTP